LLVDLREWLALEEVSVHEGMASTKKETVS
jgi:hypothetical protein